MALPPLDFNDPTDLDWVTIKTTLPKLPFEPIDMRPSLKTDRLLMRPLRESDAEAMYEMRMQPEVMRWTVQGKPDIDIEATRKNVALRLPPNDTTNFDFAICLAESGQLVGVGGSFKLKGELGWPVVGYMLRKEAWGKGYGTEFLKAFLEAWWSLPRHVVEHEVEKDTIVGDEDEVKREKIVAVTVTDNVASQNVLRKNGFELVKVWEEEDAHEASGMVTLLGYTLKKPTAVSGV